MGMNDGPQCETATREATPTPAAVTVTSAPPRRLPLSDHHFGDYSSTPDTRAMGGVSGTACGSSERRRSRDEYVGSEEEECVNGSTECHQGSGNRNAGGHKRVCRGQDVPKGGGVGSSSGDRRLGHAGAVSSGVGHGVFTKDKPSRPRTLPEAQLHFKSWLDQVVVRYDTYHEYPLQPKEQWLQCAWGCVTNYYKGRKMDQDIYVSRRTAATDSDGHLEQNDHIVTGRVQIAPPRHGQDTRQGLHPSSSKEISVYQSIEHRGRIAQMAVCTTAERRVVTMREDSQLLIWDVTPEDPYGSMHTRTETSLPLVTRIPLMMVDAHSNQRSTPHSSLKVWRSPTTESTATSGVADGDVHIISTGFDNTLVVSSLQTNGMGQVDSRKAICPSGLYTDVTFGTTIASFAAVTDTGCLVLGDTRNPNALHTVTTKASGLMSVATQPEGDGVLLGTSDGHMYLYDRRHMDKPVATYGGHDGMAVHQLQWAPRTPNGFASCGADGRVILWDVTGKETSYGTLGGSEVSLANVQGAANIVAVHSNPSCLTHTMDWNSMDEAPMPTMCSLAQLSGGPKTSALHVWRLNDCTANPDDCVRQLVHARRGVDTGL
eukprot:GFYU01007997.1.p1 GENE.GFYU01007997.1~~GFYU01007997.1.p1  ORF type:complete len:601 (+),score=84.07 GFYU01007997.1:277-2079(+)